MGIREVVTASEAWQSFRDWLGQDRFTALAMTEGEVCEARYR